MSYWTQQPQHQRRAYATYLGKLEGHHRWEILGQIYTGSVSTVGGGTPLIGRTYPAWTNQPGTRSQWVALVRAVGKLLPRGERAPETYLWPARLSGYGLALSGGSERLAWAKWGDRQDFGSGAAEPRHYAVVVGEKLYTLESIEGARYLCRWAVGSGSWDEEEEAWLPQESPDASVVVPAEIHGVWHSDVVDLISDGERIFVAVAVPPVGSSGDVYNWRIRAYDASLALLWESSLADTWARHPIGDTQAWTVDADYLGWSAPPYRRPNLVDTGTDLGILVLSSSDDLTWDVVSKSSHTRTSAALPRPSQPAYFPNIVTTFNQVPQDLTPWDVEFAFGPKFQSGALVGNFSGTVRDVWDLQIVDCLVSGGVLVPRGGQGFLPQLAAYSVVTREKLWERVSGANEIVAWRPILAHDGKLLVFRTRRTIHRQYWEQQQWPWEGVGTNTLLDQMYPEASWQYEVIDLSTGETVAVREQGATIDYVLACAAGGTQFHAEDPGWHEAPLFPVQGVLTGSPGYPGAKMIGGRWYSSPTQDPTLPGLPLRWRSTGVAVVAAKLAVPPPHSVDRWCVSSDGAYLVAAPRLNQATYSVNVSTSLTTGAEFAFGDEFRAGLDRHAVVYDWGLNVCATSKFEGSLSRVAPPLAVGGSEVLLPLMLDSDDVYRVIDAATGSTVRELSYSAYTALRGPQITTRGHLVSLYDEGHRVLNRGTP